MNGVRWRDGEAKGPRNIYPYVGTVDGGARSYYLRGTLILHDSRIQEIVSVMYRASHENDTGQFRD